MVAPLVAAAAPAIIGGLTDIAGSVFGNQSARSAARVQRHWEKMMSDTAVTRRKADLLNAGFNPLLAVGEAAATPSVSSAAQGSMTGNAGSHFAQAGQIALQSKAVESQVSLNSALTAKAQAEADKARAETEGTGAGVGGLIANEVRRAAASANVEELRVTTQNLENKLKGIDVEQRSQLIATIVQQAKTALRLEQAKVPGAEREADAWRSIMGTLYAHGALAAPIVNSAAGVVGLGKLGQWLKGGGIKPSEMPKGPVMKKSTYKSRTSTGKRGDYEEHTEYWEH